MTEKITNGDFATSDNWTLTGSAAIGTNFLGLIYSFDADYLTFDEFGPASAKQDSVFIEGKSYTVTLKGVEDGVFSIKVYNGSGKDQLIGEVDGTPAVDYSWEFTAAASDGAFYIEASNGADGAEAAIDNISAIEATSSPTVSTSFDTVVSELIPRKIKVDRYRHEPVPFEYNASYFQSEFLKLEVITDLLIRGSIESYHSPPEKVRDGLVVIADGVDWNPGLGTGMYYYYNGGWRYLG